MEELLGKIKELDGELGLVVDVGSASITQEFADDTISYLF